MFKKTGITAAKVACLLGGCVVGAMACAKGASNQIYMGLGNVSFDPIVAASADAQVDDSALAIELAFEQRKASGFVWGAGLNFYSYSDNAGFSVLTESTFGDVETSDSSASAFNGFGELGYSYMASPKLELSLMAGYEIVFSSSRSISNCSDCPSEDIDIDAGAYIVPKIVYTFENNWTLGFSYSSYVTGDVESMAMLQVGKRIQFFGGEI